MQIKGLSNWINKSYHKYVGSYSNRFNVYYGGAGSGKSHFVCQKIILKALNSKRRVLVIRKVGRTIRRSVFEMFLKLIIEINDKAKAPGFSIIKNINRSDFTIELLNGSVILFSGIDDPEKLKSIVDIDDIVIEEATELTLDDFTQLNLRLRSKKPNNQIHIMFNPVSKANWVYKYFFENGKPNDTEIIHTTYLDNINNLPQEYINSLIDLKNINPNYYKIYVLGHFATLDKLIFSNIEFRIISEEEVKSFPFWIGMDFGYVNDPTAITWGRYDKVNAIIYITGEYNRKGMTNDEIAKVIEDLGYQKERIIADSAEQKSIEEIKRFGIPRIKAAEKGKGSVNIGIDKMLRHKLIVDERCVNCKEEFENYTWKKDKKTNEYINTPIDAFNHHIDSVRYGIQSVIGKLTSWKF
ncbi:MAG: PBSX family phage terminase large subunit [Eubacteriales bacterium]